MVVLTKPSARSETPSAGLTDRAGRARAVWVSLAITAIWAAVVLVSAFGGNIVVSGGTSDAGGTTTVPSGIPVAILACIATVVVAGTGFPPSIAGRRSGEPAARHRPLQEHG